MMKEEEIIQLAEEMFNEHGLDYQCKTTYTETKNRKIVFYDFDCTDLSIKLQNNSVHLQVNKDLFGKKFSCETKGTSIKTIKRSMKMAIGKILLEESKQLS